jgi:hypothetical protein
MRRQAKHSDPDLGPHELTFKVLPNMVPLGRKQERW